MPISLNKNIFSLQALGKLDENNAHLSKALERLSSGLRINRASDDPAGLALSASLDSSARIFSQAVRNINDGISVSNVLSSALSELTSIVTHLSELAEQAANGTFTQNQRNAIDTESQALVNEYNRILESTKFNNISFFSSGFGSLVIQGGVGSSATTILDLSSVSLSLSNSLSNTLGDGTYGSAVSTSQPGFHNFGDFDGDGITDMVGVYLTGVRFAQGLGDGTFAATVNKGSMGGAQSHDNRLADINEDGFLDVVSADQNGSVYTRLGDGSGAFLGASTSVVSGFATADALQIADVNNDGHQDLVVQNASGSIGVGVFLGNGNGTYLAVITHSVAVDTGLTVVDFNNDGKLDLATGKAVYLGNGNGTFGSATVTDTAVFLTAGDFNGDGNQDLVTYATAVKIRLGNGNGTFLSAVTIPNTTGLASALNFSSIDRALSADVNGDGYSDLALDFSTSNQLRVYLSNGNGTFTPSATITTSGANLWRFEDTNQDGVIDVDSIIFGTGVANTFLGNAVTNASTFGIDLSTQANAQTSLTVLTSNLAAIANAESIVSAFESRLIFQQDYLSNMANQYRVASSRIKDIDVAEEVANLLKAQIQAQAATSILAHANLQPEIVLNLLDF